METKEFLEDLQDHCDQMNDLLRRALKKQPDVEVVSVSEASRIAWVNHTGYLSCTKEVWEDAFRFNGANDTWLKTFNHGFTSGIEWILSLNPAQLEQLRKERA